VPWIEPEDVARMISGATYDVTGGDTAHNAA
jgi:hypothetical protein